MPALAPGDPLEPEELFRMSVYPCVRGVMVYSFGRVGAVVAIRAEDYTQQGKSWLSSFKELDPIPQYKATGKLAGFLQAAEV